MEGDGVAPQERDIRKRDGGKPGYQNFAAEIEQWSYGRRRSHRAIAMGGYGCVRGSRRGNLCMSS